MEDSSDGSSGHFTLPKSYLCHYFPALCFIITSVNGFSEHNISVDDSEAPKKKPKTDRDAEKKNNVVYIAHNGFMFVEFC